MKRSIKKNRIFSVAACFLLPLLATSAFAQQCVGDRAWRAAENGTNGTGNAVHANALYRSLITFQSEVDTPLPVWPSRHGTAPTETITAREVADVRGPWGGFDHVIEALTCLEAVVETVEATDTVEPATVDNSPQPLVDPQQEQQQVGVLTAHLGNGQAGTIYGEHPFGYQTGGKCQLLSEPSGDYTVPYGGYHCTPIEQHYGKKVVTFRIESPKPFQGKVKVHIAVVSGKNNFFVDTPGGRFDRPGFPVEFFVDMKNGTSVEFDVVAGAGSGSNLDGKVRMFLPDFGFFGVYRAEVKFVP